MRLINRLFVCFLILCLPGYVYGQSPDFGIWHGFGVEHSFTEKLDVNFFGQLRTFDDASLIDQAYLEGSVTYKLTRHLSFAVSYRHIDKREINSEYYIRRDWFADIKSSLPLRNFSFSSRLRFQTETRTYYKDQNDRLPDYHGRIKLKALYKIPGFPVDPYLSVETFSPLFSKSDYIVDKERFMLGADYKISKKHMVEAEYIFQRDYLSLLSNINIISISYNFKF